MINLLGCSKENFLKLMELMNYKHKKTKDSKDYYFTYQPQHNKNNKDKIKALYFFIKERKDIKINIYTKKFVIFIIKAKFASKNIIIKDLKSILFSSFSIKLIKINNI